MSERLLGWYEGNGGFTCVSGRARRSGGTQWRRCVKELPESLRHDARREYLELVKSELTSQLSAL